MKQNQGRDEIMEATYSALSKYGYTELTIQKIADELGKEKSLIYRHFDDKEDLMLEFLDHFRGEIRKEIQKVEGEDPDTRLDHFIKMMLAIGDEELWMLRIAIYEISSRAPYEKEIADKFVEIDNLILDFLINLFEDRGDNEPEKKARLILSTATGAMHRSIFTQQRETLEDMEKWLEEFFG